jgi:phosphatidylserine/phosphatidylglycerophosphate/cardiolipin synthase-like enzyme
MKYPISALLLALGLGVPVALFAQDSGGNAAPLKPVPAVPTPVTALEGGMHLYFAPQPAGADGTSKALCDFVRQATRSIDVAIFEIDDPAFVQALLDMSSKVRVRIVMDSDNFKDANLPLRQKHLVVGDYRTPLMHTKLVAVDGARIFAGSLNATISAEQRQDNNCFTLEAPELAARVGSVVDHMWAQGPVDRPAGTNAGDSMPSQTKWRRLPASTVAKVGGQTIEMYMAPEDKPLDRIIAEVSAKDVKTIQFLAFDLSEPRLIAAIEAAKANGVTVSGVFERTLAGAGLAALSKAGCNVEKDANPNGFMHDKVILINAGDPKTARTITGSFNFSGNAASSNDEDMFIIRSPEVTKAYVPAFDRIFKMGADALPSATTTAHGLVDAMGHVDPDKR